MQGTWVQSLGWEDPLEEEMATHSSILARRIPWTEAPGGLQSIGLQRVRRDWRTNTFTICGEILYDAWHGQNTHTHTHTRLFSYSSGGQKSEISTTGPTSRWRQSHMYSRGSRGEFVPCFFQLLWPSAFLGLWPHHYNIYLHLHTTICVCVCMYMKSPFARPSYKDRYDCI